MQKIERLNRRGFSEIVHTLLANLQSSIENQKRKI